VLELIPSPQAWLAFLTLSVLEIVLGIDNLIFIALLITKLPAEHRRTARLAGLGLAMVTRIALLYAIVWLTRLTEPLFRIGDEDVSWRDVVLFCGGLFLLGKSVVELHHSVEGEAGRDGSAAARDAAGRNTGRNAGRDAPAVPALAFVVVQIALIDIVFSLDSVFTAVGLANDLTIMVAAIVVAIVVMMLVSGSLGEFIERHPTIKVLALAFLLLIGLELVAQALHFDIPKGYLYFAMAFAAGVELINIRARRARRKRVAPPGSDRQSD
jgi:predicted tellurium resistance membrane protein TerC